MSEYHSVVQFECEDERFAVVPLDMGLNTRGAWIRCKQCDGIHHAEVHHD